MGSILMKKFLHHKEKVLVIDYNPEIKNALIKNKVSCIYGDIASPELLSKINIKKLKLVVSTAPGFEENIHLLKEIKKVNKKTKVIVTGARISETLRLYEKGADYVITPKILAGEELARVLHPKRLKLSEAKRHHLKRLKDVHNIFY